RPTVDLTSQSTTLLKTGGASTRDHFRYPALTSTKDVVGDRAKREMEAAEARVSLYEAGSRFGALRPGGKFSLSCRPASSDDGTYVLREVSHAAQDTSWLAGGGAAEYSNHFSAFPVATNWRQPLDTPRPRMEGIHVALVLGPNSQSGNGVKDGESEEIYTDSLARVKVRFFWDQRKDANGALACWARVVQPWAGNGWGAQFIPRIGTEVAVAFVDSDPDRPIVIGGLYNGSDAPIYSDSDKTKSGFRSRSSLKGGNADFNEFTFDDKKDSELIFMHAQKDLTTEVEHDQTLTVDNCRVVTVKKDETVDIQNNQTIKVKNDHTFTVTDGNRSVSVDQGNNTFTVKQGNHTVSINTGDYIATVKQGKHTLDVTQGDYNVTVGQGNHVRDVQTGNYAVKVEKGNHTLSVQLGDYTVKADAGTISMEATKGINLTVGGNSIKIEPSGITVNGTMLKLQGQAQAEMAAPMTKVSGDGMLTLKGGIMMLN
ncbi:MAG TPA: type VI secretion system tip protein TssI/VgrG, partial [Acetobacteraceae bacterium]